MKKIMTLLLLALPMAIMAQSVELSPTFAAPEGNDGEEYGNAFDGRNDTKWCCEVNSEDDLISVQFKVETPTSVKGYYFVTGEDVTYAGSNRNPKAWTLYARVSAYEGWVKIAEEQSPSLPTAPQKRSQYFDVTDKETEYADFRLEFYGIVSGTVFEMSEIGIIGGDTDMTDLYYIFDEYRMTATVGNNPEAAGDIVIPRTVKKNGAIYKVTAITEDAFRRCTYLTSVKMPNTIKSIGSGAFEECERLTSVELPNALDIIGSRVFRTSGLESVTIPSSVRIIEDRAFDCCTDLRQIYCYAEQVPIVYDPTTFTETIYYNATLFVPGQSIQAYKEANFWNQFYNIKDINIVGKYINDLKTFFEVLNADESTISGNLWGKLEEGIDSIGECDSEDEAAQAMNEAKSALFSAYTNEKGLTPATPEGAGMRMKIITNSDKAYEFKTQDVKSVDYYQVNE